MPQSKVVTGILSYGMSGRVFHAPFIEKHPQFQLRAIVERHTKRAQADYPQIISYDTVDQLFEDSEIELIIVNTPNDTHVDYAVRALRAGKHVVLEKPFAPTAGEAAFLFRVARQQGKQIFPFHNRRFDSDFQSLKSVLDAGDVGRPIELHIRFDRFKSEIGPKGFKEKAQPASGVLYDLGSHLIDQVLSLWGRPKAMTKIRGAYRKDSQVDDYACILLNYEGGLNVFITTSLLVANPQASFVLHGTDGSFIKYRTDLQEAQLIGGMMPDHPEFGIEAEDREGILTVPDEHGQMISRLVPAERGNYMEVFQSIFSAIRQGHPYFVSEEQIMWQLEILETVK